MRVWAEPVENLNLQKQNIALPYQKEEWFFKDKKGQLFPYYKEDIYKIIDVYKPSTFLPFMQALDIPYIEEEWLSLVKHQMISNATGKLSYVFGKYLAKMKLFSYKSLTFQESTKIFTNIYTYKNFVYKPKISFEIQWGKGE